MVCPEIPEASTGPVVPPDEGAGGEFALTRWKGHRAAGPEGRIELRVRYVETDQMGVVYHANHLVWCEMGRVDWLDRIGLPYREIERRGLYLPVVEIACRYLAPAHFDETIAVVTRLVGLGRNRARFGYCLFGPADRRLAEAYSEHVAVDTSMRSVRLPDWLREKLTPMRPT
ncbi:MAG: acyl-CoA thioesterase [Candidatus Riflebacteria bacterium]|nr:acyl-CoA thioesterase [Candidatus Riflebacteria bacterium]